MIIKLPNGAMHQSIPALGRTIPLTHGQTIIETSLLGKTLLQDFQHLLDEDSIDWEKVEANEVEELVSEGSEDDEEIQEVLNEQPVADAKVETQEDSKVEEDEEDKTNDQESEGSNGDGEEESQDDSEPDSEPAEPAQKEVRPLDSFTGKDAKLDLDKYAEAEFNIKLNRQKSLENMYIQFTEELEKLNK